ncbi:MAG TPA: TonB-dependent receptor [Wenzhouxiangella sp.]
MRRNRLSEAIGWVLAAGAVTAVQAQDTESQDESQSREVDRMVVTATRTEAQDMQSTAVAVQAMDGETLDDMGVDNFDDLQQSMPGITAASRGPGQQTIFIRGMAVQPISVLLSGAQGTQPNVALYLDEQPATAPGRNMDIYVTDLERIEVLPGPQGTLFGASSQAGTIRYITNKPELGTYEAGFTASSSFIKDGDMNASGEGYFNLPIGDRTAMRLAYYSVQLGGYIDNVFGEFTLDPSVNADSAVDLGPDATYETINNLDLVEEDFNDSFYKGIRFGLYHEFNNDWDILVQNTYQQLGADGVFDYDPDVGDLEVNRFFPDKLRDEFNQLSWTVNGRAGMLDLVYTGAYLDRQVDQNVDYTGYNNSGAFIAYYTCTYDNPNYITNYNIDPQFITENRSCLDPTKGTIIDQKHERFTNEFRFSTPADNRWRFVGGVFMDDYKIETQDDFAYLATADLGFAPNAPMADAQSINPDTRPPGIAFFNDITREEEQIAFFGEFSYDLIPNTLKATVGVRRYDLESSFVGSSNFANGIFAGSIDGDSGRDYERSGGHSPEPLEQKDTITRFNLSWTPIDNALFYATYSEGFRPGGFNRGGGLASVNPDFPTVQVTYDTDDVTNYEMGWKTSLLDNTLRFNGSVYWIEWDNMQVSRFDPQNVSILTFIENSADSEIFGIEGDFVWRATQNFTLFGAFSYNDTELKSVDAQVIELAPVGSSLPLVPEFQAYLRGRYERMVDWGFADLAFVQASGSYAGHSYSSLVAEVRERQSGYSIVNASAGIAKNDWSVELFVDNVFDKRAELFINEQDDIPRVTTNRPMTAGIKFSYQFTGY